MFPTALAAHDIDHMAFSHLIPLPPLGPKTSPVQEMFTLATVSVPFSTLHIQAPLYSLLWDPIGLVVFFFHSDAKL